MQLEKKFANKSSDNNNCNLSNLNVILFCKVDSNKNLRSLLNTNKLEKNIHKKIDNNKTLCYVNKSCVIKTKDCSTKAKNKKDTILRTNKTKTRSIKRNSSNFKYVKASIKILRDSNCCCEQDRGKSISILS